MKKLLTITILLISNLSFSQLKAVIINSETKEKIPYVNIWIENENIGTTSNENGEFIIDNSKGEILILSSLGYETERIDLSNIPSKIFLVPKMLELDEVIISTKKEKKEKIIGTFDNEDISHYYASDNNPEIKARLFPFDSTYVETPYLKTIKLSIYSEVRNARFNIRLYSVGVNGEPEKPIHEKNIIGTVKKGTENVKLDLADLYISFPKNGLFVSYEWLIIKENELKLSFPIKDSKKRIDRVLYEPKVGLLRISENTKSWIYKNGKWKKTEKFKGDSPKPYLDNYGILAIELKLTD